MRFLAFDGWRGILSLLVVISHFPGVTSLHETRFEATGSTLVDLFFIFSGFVIVAAFEKPLREGYSIRRFLVERLGRLYPIHFVVLALFVVTEAALSLAVLHFDLGDRAPFSGIYSASSIFTNLLLVHSWGFEELTTWNYPSWSLSTEWAAYLFFVFAMLAPGRRFWPFALAGIVASVLVLFFVAPRGMGSTNDYGIYRSILGFSLGAFCFYAFWTIQSRGLAERLSFAAFTALEVLALALVVALQMSVGLTPWAVAIPFGEFLFLLTFAFGRGALSAFVSRPVFLWLGAISLSVYIVHAYLILRLLNVATVAEMATGLDLVRPHVENGWAVTLLNGPAWAMNLLALLLLAATVGISHFTYKYVEMPGQALFKRYAKRFRSRRAPVPAAAALAPAE